MTIEITDQDMTHWTGLPGESSHAELPGTYYLADGRVIECLPAGQTGGEIIISPSCSKVLTAEEVGEFAAALLHYNGAKLKI